MTRLADRMDELAAAFYRGLFEALPEVRSLFGTDMEAQGEKFTTMLAYLVRSLRQWSVVEPAARLSGSRHVGYGVTAAHYRVAGAALVSALGEAQARTGRRRPRQRGGRPTHFSPS